ncbi:MAG TPA: ABC transporter permease subunit [Abditibacterium sp.]|jgi:ABC-type transport system involved in multi-copper enzyme maturation permease subunit
MNPILAREIRARFRERYSFLLLFALTLVLSVAAYWIYSDAVSYNDIRASSVYSSGQSVSTQKASEIGRNLFSALAMVNCLAWLLVAPALTATGLARERERGLLESLWLSPFRVRSQIGGRYAASLLFLGLLQLATAPVYGLAMLLGGVSPGEVGLCGLIIAMTAVVGAAIGLWCSARAYRPVGALGSALGFIVIWSLAAFYGPSLFYAVFFYFNILWVPQVMGVLAAPHPLLLLGNIVEPANAFTISSPLLSDNAIYGLGFGVQAAASLFLLFRATRTASKPLPDMAWIGRHPFLERWKRRLEARKIEREARREAAKMSEKVGGALLYEVPFEKLARFRDPILQREVRGRFRLRQSGFAVALGRLLALFITVVVWLWMIFGLFFPDTRGGQGIALMCLLWFLGALTVAVIASSSLTRERESGTWQGLHLSLLRPVEIVRSKWLSPLVTYAFWSAPLWLWLPLSVQWRAEGPGTALFPLLGATILVVVTLALVSALGLFISSLLRHSAAATSWTLAALVTLFWLLPVAADTTGLRATMIEWAISSRSFMVTGSSQSFNYRRYNYGSNYYDDSGEWFRTGAIFDSYSPIATADNLLSPSRYRSLSGGTKTFIWLLCLSDCTLLTLILLAATKRQLQKREK